VAGRPIELWGGFECTVNRVGDEQLDQLRRCGHDERPEDLDLLPPLGIRTVRFPVLWERVERDGWSWADERLGRLQELGIRPIVGLVHHGSGPPRTNLLDPDFARGLADFAATVARRYPWVDRWTPVNEPNTTARFSCLYGLWYPHERDGRAYGHAIVSQCRATVLAMDAVRAVNPAAQLVQTDDLMKAHGTALLRYQVEHENERRWLAYDLLTGTLTPEHLLWRWFDELDFPVEELDWFRDHPCPPDILGFNHYLSGERFLDHRIDRYEAEVVGGNYVHRYADVVAGRVLGAGHDGPEALLREAWERYKLPLAVTECHNGSTREEQLRWLDQVWRAAQTLRGDGIDIRAVTVWSLLGAHGWNKLLCAGLDHYETGVFDLRSGRPRPTALAAMTRGLALQGSYDHPVLGSPGWWTRPDRLWYPAEGDVAQARPHTGPPLLITGGAGTLGQAFARICEERGLRHRSTTHLELDLADPRQVQAALDELRPWVVVNAAGYVRVDDAELEPDRCFRDNRESAATLARACGERRLPLVTFSSDLVFDGTAGRPYVESDRPAPLNVYGRSKAEAEQLVLAVCAEALVVRTSAFFGPWDAHNFVRHALRALEDGEPFDAVADVVVAPTYVPDLVHETLDLLIDGETGIWHLAGADAVSWHELARLAAEAAELDPAPLNPIAAADAAWLARRPAAAVLGTERGAPLARLAAALPRYLEAVSAGTRRAQRAPH
jgi:dTDP-4-dehydrorhamnose reductase